MQELDNSLPFEDMIRARTKAWADEYDEANRARIAELVTLTMRKRGDYFGYFNNISRVSQWRPFTGKGMVSYPVINRTIRSKTATSVSTKIQLEIESYRSIPEKQAGAELAKNIYKFLSSQNLTKQLEAMIAEINQLGRFSFVLSNYRQDGGVQVDIPEMETRIEKFGQTLFGCHSCGMEWTPEDLGVPDIADDFKDRDLEEAKTADSEFQIAGEGGKARPLESAAENAPEENPKMLAPAPAEAESGALPPMRTDGDDSGGGGGDENALDAEYSAIPEMSDEDRAIDEHTAGLVCPECQTNTLIFKERARSEEIDAMTGGYYQRDTGTMDTKVVSPLLIRLDTYKAIGFQYQNSDWFNYHPLVPAYEIYALAPHLLDKLHDGSHQKWSEGARWHFELNNNSSTSGGYSYKTKNYQLDDLIEPNFWWIAPHACVGWKSPDNYELPYFSLDEEGTPQPSGTFTIALDETIETAAKRQSPDGKFRGLLVAMIGEHVAAVGNEHFIEKWTGFPWKIDAQSFYPQGEESLLKLADAATNMLSMAFAHGRRASNPKLVVDTRKFAKKDVERNEVGQIVYTDNTLPETADSDWRKFIGYLAPEDLSATVFQLINLIIEISKEESGVFNETVGNSNSSDETLGGRKMMLNQSLSLQTPVEQSKGVALIELAFCWLELFQKQAPDEAYHLIKGTFEEEWKPSDIEAFRALNIRKELFITVVEGTDIPKTQVEMEQRFMIALNLGLFQEDNPIPLQVRSHIVKSVLGIDFDISNYSAYKRLAAERFKNIKQELEILEPNEALTIELDPMSGFPMRVLRPEIVASIAQDVRTAPRQTDQHLVFIEYYTDQLNGIVGAKEPDEVLVAALEKQIDTHRAFVAMNTAQAIAAQSAAEGGGAAPAPAQQPGKPGEKKPAQAAPPPQ